MPEILILLNSYKEIKKIVMNLNKLANFWFILVVHSFEIVN